MKKSIGGSLAAAVFIAAAGGSACGAHQTGFGGPGDDGGDNGDDATSAGSFGSSGSGAGSGSGFGGQNGSSGGSGSSSTSSTATTCDSTCGAAGGTCSGTACTVVENPGTVSSANQAKLKAGGAADSTFTWLYPYDKTVFARGLVSPTLQFGGGAADSVYVHVTGTGIDYQGFLVGGAAGVVNSAMSQTAWDAITHAVGATSITVQVSKISGSSVTGPLSETWPVAQGSLRGTIYYETYLSTIIGGNSLLAAATGIGIMKIQPGAKQPTVLLSGCGNVCHSASADGSTLVSSTGTETTADSRSWNLKSNGAPISPVQDDNIFTYGALYRDGTFEMSATNYRAWLGSGSKLYDTTTGANIAAPGWDGVVTNGGTTAFSPDGTMLGFIHEDKDQGHTLSKMAFAAGTKTFSGLVDLATDPDNYLAWPAFTPDEKTVIYHAGSDAAFETDEGATGDVYAVDIASKTVQRLDQLDGYTGSGTASYLPANDPHLNFAPTVLPEAVGGYFWAVFTSHRSYGNLSPSMSNGDENGKLWVAAIDIGGTPGTDTSHPAFYLDGQELTADNLRGYWVLPPCQGTGTSCTSGDECCTGFCRGSGTDLECVSPPAGCANDGEHCTTSANCCNSSDQCIGGYCSQSAPQ
jgi:hypothetical protein